MNPAGPTHCAGSKLQRKVDLPGDFDEATCRVKVLADFVSFHRLDRRVSQALATEIIQSVLDELAADAFASCFGDKSDVRNTTLAGGTIHRRRNVTQYYALAFRDEDSNGIGRGIVIDVTHLSPPPVVAVQDSKTLLHQFIKGRAAEGFGGDPFEHFKI